MSKFREKWAILAMLFFSGVGLIAQVAGCVAKQIEHPGEVQVWCRITSKTDSQESSIHKTYIYNYECPKTGSVVAP